MTSLDEFFADLSAVFGALPTRNVFDGCTSGDVNRELSFLHENLATIVAHGIDLPSIVYAADDPAGRRRTFRLLIEATGSVYSQFEDTGAGLAIRRLHQNVRHIRAAIDESQERVAC